ncbi:MAG: phospho-sugar mutase [Oscillospiraceae bacterium]|jgi:phosphoglucomutase|nr:phospho-sugar mutase [Oscillospiraceae bacterium]
MPEDYLNRYNTWLGSPCLTDAERAELQAISGNEDEIKSRFFKDVEFGTAGLRGVMGAGTNCINAHIVRHATQCVCDVFLTAAQKPVSRFTSQKIICITYDSRHNSREYAQAAAEVVAANGITAYLTDDIRPTPELSFAVRYYGAIAGINITASHNTAEYNGYKVYDNTGGQILKEFAVPIAEKMRDNDIFSYSKRVPFNEALEKNQIRLIGKAATGTLTQTSGVARPARRRQDTVPADLAFLQELELGTKSRRIEPYRRELAELRVVYTPLFGAGRDLVPNALRNLGIKNLFPVPSQSAADGDFPGLASPNPEFPESFAEALKLADEKDADIIIATDPDCDRVAVMAKPDPAAKQYVHISGNKTGVLMIDHILNAYRQSGTTPENTAIVKSIVTTEMGRAAAESYGASCIDTFTGFKYIAKEIDRLTEEEEATVVFAFEESYGHLAGDYVRDKDAVTAAVLICEIAARAASEGLTLIGRLEQLYSRLGYFEEKTLSFVFPGADGFFTIKSLIEALRAAPPTQIGGTAVIGTRDYLPEADMLRYALADGSAVIVRPSGTEPTIKAYVLVKGGSAQDAQEKAARYSGWAAETIK